MKRSLKYLLLLSVIRALPVKKIMASPPEKAQKTFKKACKGVQAAQNIRYGRDWRRAAENI